MRLLLLATITAVIGATTTYACSYRTTQHSLYEQQIPSDTLTVEDSLRLIYEQIDLLSYFDLKKMRESFIYRNRTQPSYLNKQVLIYIEERLKITK
ncbi:hypothetical protein [Fluviicola taffensis]|uniref:DUF4296 domain-containing protein n=1 Tax=Fluviicola taffensis (strain DSM 16823 / NCIMB 13979 / RW262) TaxID=755732 RepID=F2IB31_FLUTR|nr:hypothetical protein [Fluviicola taffensis]AEA42114.1 hypothetical protein Fluta_0104 [Fluviicola taffensis DSM 16823]